MRVAAHLLDGAPPPPELSRALNCQAWGVGDMMNLPAGMLPKMNITLNYYRAIRGYQEAAANTATVEFTKKHPHDWEMVSWVIAERKKGNG